MGKRLAVWSLVCLMISSCDAQPPADVLEHQTIVNSCTTEVEVTVSLGNVRVWLDILQPGETGEMISDDADTDNSYHFSVKSGGSAAAEFDSAETEVVLEGVRCPGGGG